jgi:hypothetical protein
VYVYENMYTFVPLTQRDGRLDTALLGAAFPLHCPNTHTQSKRTREREKGNGESEKFFNKESLAAGERRSPRRGHQVAGRVVVTLLCLPLLSSLAARRPARLGWPTGRLAGQHQEGGNSGSSSGGRSRKGRVALFGGRRISGRSGRAQTQCRGMTKQIKFWRLLLPAV